MSSDKYCVIMAGGVGSRFWPISRTARPKQFLDILGVGKTFIRQTYERFARSVPPENFLVVTNAAYRDTVLREIPEIAPRQVLCEPLGRNTAPCIAYAAFRLAARNPRAVMIVTPADHLILDADKFTAAVEECAEVARSRGSLVTIGIKPTRPDTGYGYIQADVRSGDGTVAKVKTFTEKPNAEVARVFVESGEFFWNSGIFVWRTDVILEQIRKFLPDTYQLFDSVGEHYGAPDEQEHINRVYPECRAISIDFGVMEKADNVYVRLSDFGWSDIGTWGSLYQHSPKDDDGNVNEAGAALAFDTSNSIIKLPEGKIAVIEGLDDYIVVDTEDVLMICPRSNEQNIKKFIDTVKFDKGDSYI